jgi:hypothetical protein
MIQAILFNKNKWTMPEVENYIKDKNIKLLKKIHETSNYYRCRIHTPDFKNYMTTPEHHGIRYVVGF